VSGAILVPVLSQLLGLAALWSVRTDLGRWGYPLASFAVGWLALALGAGAGTALGRPFDAVTIAVGAALLLVVAWLSWAVIEKQDVGRGSTLAGALDASLSLAVVAAVSVGAGAYGRAIAVGDSLGIESLGIFLVDTGTLDASIMSFHHPLPVAIHAAERVFGAQFAFISQITFGAFVAVFLGFLVLAELHHLDPAKRALVAATTLLVAVTNSVWLWNWLYIHTHMASTAFLLLAVGGVRRAVGDGSAASRRPGWLLAAGLSAAGLAMMRPDGLVYVFAIVAVLVAARLELGLGGRDVAGFFTALLGALLVTYGLVVRGIGLWDVNLGEGSPSGDGATALIVIVLLAVLAVAALALSLADRWPVALGGWLSREGRVRRLVVAAIALAVPIAWLVDSEKSAAAFENAARNLALLGGWGVFWYVALGFAVVAVLSTLVLDYDWRRMLISLAIVSFFGCMVLVHSVGHPGRLGWGDSLNRVIFHVVPLIYWYGAVLVDDLVEVSREQEQPLELAREHTP
jgi:hypothetical protein